MIVRFHQPVREKHHAFEHGIHGSLIDFKIKIEMKRKVMV